MGKYALGTKEGRLLITLQTLWPFEVMTTVPSGHTSALDLIER